MLWSNGGSSSQCPMEERWGPDLLWEQLLEPNFSNTSLPFHSCSDPQASHCWLISLEKGGVVWFKHRLRNTSLYICLLLGYIHMNYKWVSCYTQSALHRHVWSGWGGIGWRRRVVLRRQLWAEPRETLWFWFSEINAFYPWNTVREKWILLRDTQSPA